ncbi:hypothetical protein F7725_012738 [Dissostichus mawsoni]|uniref:HAT C-terminal dimerisation domain-containing protein n=1 Tax=Dissostichus mawsoni TaxID=36200 RepID=A0A7J5YN71_DISMA|nr:hypothetical protein F7725_012738 [Dissostichus mawsoni]
MYHIKNKHQDTIPNDVVSVAAHTEVTELISRMIEKDMLPISLLRGDGFRELLAYTVHNYKMPSAEDIIRLIEGHFQEKAEELLVQLGKVEKVALTADFWTALPFQRYVTVSCSFITEDWQGRSVVLQTHKLSSDSHTSTDSVTERLFNTVETWVSDGLSEDLVRIIVAAGKLNFTPVLATLKWATTVISAETEVSISNIYPITFSLIQTHLVPKENDVEQVSEFKLKVQKLLQNHMEVDSNGLASKPALIASMLDPRHKHLSFLTPTGRLSAKVKLHELVAKLDVITTTVGLKDEHQEILVTPDVSREAAMPSQLRSDTKNTMMLLLGDNYSSSYATDSEAQVDYYLRDIAPSLDINPLDWWKVNGPRFPKLATLARHYLCVPGVSLPSLLSESGQTFAKMRTRLAPEHVDMMIFVNRNA